MTSFPLSSGMDGSSPRLRCPRKHDASLEPRVATHLLLANSRSSRTRLSEAERAERRQRDRERLKQAAEQLLTSEGWQRWVRVRAQAGLRRLSLSNQLLVAMACPEAPSVR